MYYYLGFKELDYILYIQQSRSYLGRHHILLPRHVRDRTGPDRGICNAGHTYKHSSTITVVMTYRYCTVHRYCASWLLDPTLDPWKMHLGSIVSPSWDERERERNVVRSPISLCNERVTLDILRLYSLRVNLPTYSLARDACTWGERR